jgi:hypothetical protein
MQLHAIDHKAPPDFQKAKAEVTTAVPPGHAACVTDEINAYVAIRDSQLVEVEQHTTLQNLKRAELTNTFVESCLNSARSPYEAQNFPEASARFERKRCEVIKNRIAELRAAIASKAPAQAA